jgi:hypothetical protein
MAQLQSIGPKHLTPAERAKVQALNPEQRMQFDERVAICVEGGVQEHKAEWVAFREVCLAHAGNSGQKNRPLPSVPAVAD